MPMKNEYLRSLPSVDKLLNVKNIQNLEGSFGRPLLTEAVRNVLNIERENLLQRNIAGASTYSELTIKIEKWLQTETSLTLQPVINATGVILHTNLGRAPLSNEAREAIFTISKDYNTLEYDLDLGKRGPRGTDVDNLICRTTGSEAALVVNNNAAAVLLILKALAERRSVVISRGQLIEIGGGFRIPDVIKQSEVNLVEVGTTNRTHPHDYHQAIREQHNNVALIMRAHHSNYNIVGFVTEPNLQELVTIGLEHNIPVLDDLGSGTLLDTSTFGLTHEPTVQDSLNAGASLVCFSADKLLGGPQAGIIIGNKHLINKLRNHPLARAMRADKLCIAALSATLLHYIKDEAIEKIPVWQMIAMDISTIKTRAQRVVDQVGGKLVSGLSTIGGGSLPGETLPTILVSLRVESSERLTQDMRNHKIIGRIQDNQVMLDLRTVLPHHDDKLISILNDLLSISA
jgi:L-seryl-tRNA(Ser) seleniumtransferase